MTIFAICDRFEGSQAMECKRTFARTNRISINQTTHVHAATIDAIAQSNRMLSCILNNWIQSNTPPWIWTHQNLDAMNGDDSFDCQLKFAKQSARASPSLPIDDAVVAINWIQRMSRIREKKNSGRVITWIRIPSPLSYIDNPRNLFTKSNNAENLSNFGFSMTNTGNHSRS